MTDLPPLRTASLSPIMWIIRKVRRMDVVKASAAEVSKNFGQFADKALVEPVMVTKHGRDHLVILSADEYARLKRRDRQVYRAHEVPEDLLSAIAAAEPPRESEDAELMSTTPGRRKAAKTALLRSL